MENKVTIYLSNLEKEKIKEVADAESLSYSSFIRSFLLKEINKIKKREDLE